MQGAAQTRLALYNPHQPDALYLLADAPSKVAANLTELPADYLPQLLEVLPLYRGELASDHDARRARGAQTHAANAPAYREVLRATAPVLAARAEQGAALLGRLEPLRASIQVAGPMSAPPRSGMAASPLGRDLAEDMDEQEADLVAAAERVQSRRQQAAFAAQQLDASSADLRALAGDTEI